MERAGLQGLCLAGGAGAAARQRPSAAGHASVGGAGRPGGRAHQWGPGGQPASPAPLQRQQQEQQKQRQAGGEALPTERGVSPAAAAPAGALASNAGSPMPCPQAASIYRCDATVGVNRSPVGHSSGAPEANGGGWQGDDGGPPLLPAVFSARVNSPAFQSCCQECGEAGCDAFALTDRGLPSSRCTLHFFSGDGAVAESTGLGPEDWGAAFDVGYVLGPS